MSGGSRLTLILTLKVGLWGLTAQEEEEEAVPASVNYHQTVMLCLCAPLLSWSGPPALSARDCVCYEYYHLY